MKPRHARAIRAGILAARQDVRLVMFASDLMAAAYKRAGGSPEAAETFTHPTTPTTADKAAKPSARTQKEQQ